jgi:predicted metal-binding protein
MNKEILELTDDAGAIVRYEHYSAEMDVADFEYDIRYKELCGACPEQGRRFSCPPYSPFFPDYIEKAEKANVFCVRFPREFFSGLAEGEDFLTRFFRKAGNLLVDTLLQYRGRGLIVAGSGPCLACDPCAAERGLDKCPYEEKRMYSLESLGVNVAGLCKKAFDLDLEWSSEGRPAEHVCAVGAAFF